MKRIFRLAFAEWVHAKTWLLLFSILVVGAICAPLLVPYQIDGGLAAPARGQCVYILSFLLIAFYSPSVAAEIGRAQVRNNHRLFWRAQGIQDGRYYLALLGAAAVPTVALSAAAGVVIRVAGASELGSLSLLQAVTLTALAGVVALPIAIGVAQRSASTVAGISAIGVNLIGYYGPGILDYVRVNEQLSQSARVAAELVASVIPHLRLGDQAERVTFAWAAITSGWFAASCLYLVMCLIVSGIVGFVLFSRRSV